MVSIWRGGERGMRGKEVAEEGKNKKKKKGRETPTRRAERGREAGRDAEPCLNS